MIGLFPHDQASFQRANVLMSMERYGEALVELEVVRDNVPKESAVYFLMGKVSILLWTVTGEVQIALGGPRCPCGHAEQLVALNGKRGAWCTPFVRGERSARDKLALLLYTPQPVRRA